MLDLGLLRLGHRYEAKWKKKTDPPLHISPEISVEGNVQEGVYFCTISGHTHDLPLKMACFF